MWIAAAIAAASAGCLSDNLVACGDELCTTTQVCAPSGNACVDPDQIAACSGLVDGTPCTPSTSAPGTCKDGVCVQFCGDGVVEAGEQCDDGNTNPADGCDACMLVTWQATAAIGGGVTGATTSLSYPNGVAIDRDGNAYIADTDNHLVRRVDAATGFIVTIAGNGLPGETGDGGPAVAASLEYPYGVAVDGFGNVYVADTHNNRIRQIDTNGIITTVVGTGVQSFGGDAGPAIAAQINVPYGVAVDGLGNLYIADTGNNRIRRVDAVTGTITTVAGTGAQGNTGVGGLATAATFGNPSGIAVDAAGNLMFTDYGYGRVLRVDAATGILTLVAGGNNGGDGGLATNARLDLPFGVCVDGSGNVYVSAIDDDNVRRVDAATGIITTFAGNPASTILGDSGPAIDARLSSPRGLGVDAAGNVYIADQDDGRIRLVTPATGIITTYAGSGTISSGDGGAATSAQLDQPMGTAVDAAGNLYIADTYDQIVRRVDAATGVITTVAGTGTEGFGGDGGAATAALLDTPMGVAFDPDGNLLIADTLNCRVRRVDKTTGIITTIVGNGTLSYSGDNGPAISATIARPAALVFDSAGDLYIADTDNYRIRRVDAASGNITTVAGNGTFGYNGDNGPATGAELSVVSGVALDGANDVYISDTTDQLIRRVDATTGVITTVAGTESVDNSTGDGGLATSGSLYYPGAIALDGAGDLFITTLYGGNVRRVDATSHIITTIAGVSGGAVTGADGDGGPAANALLYRPGAVTSDTAGDLWIADTFNSRIRYYAAATGVLTTVAGSVEPAGMGPLAQGRLADPRAIVVTGSLTVFAGGTSGTVQAIQNGLLGVVAGRYAQATAIGALARFRNLTFGKVSGVAYDATAGIIYLTESSANRIHAVTIVDPNDADTWTIAPLAGAAGTPGFADGAVATAMFRAPTGLYLDAAAHVLYVADTGNHVIRAIDLGSMMVKTVIGTPATLGFDGDGGSATTALLYQPQALVRCGNGDWFIADTGNNRVRRVDSAGTITTVLGDGVAASSGEGGPATTFPVNAPLGVACDANGNVYATSTTTVRELAASSAGVVDGTGPVLTIYGAAPRTKFPSSVTSCLTGIAVVDAMTLQVADSCTGLLVQLARP